MRLAEYYGGRRLAFLSSLAPAEVERRINDAAVSRFRPFATGVIGWARLGRLSLRCRPGFRNDLRPVLAGSIRDAGAGSRLELRYGAPLFMYLAPMFWLGFGLIVLAALLSSQGAPAATAPSAAFFFMAAFLFALPVVQLHLALRTADSELPTLVAFLEKNAGSTVLSGV